LKIKHVIVSEANAVETQLSNYITRNSQLPGQGIYDAPIRLRSPKINGSIFNIISINLFDQTTVLRIANSLEADSEFDLHET